MAVLHRLAITHFKHTHPTRHHGDPMPIAMQMNFLRRTNVGRATLIVKDAKLGARTSTIHVTLSQGEPDQDEKPTDRVVGYITVSDPVSEVGLTASSDWTLYPPPPSTRPPEIKETESTESAHSNTDGNSPWVLMKDPFSGFRHVMAHHILYGPLKEHRRRNVGDQWARFHPRGPKGGPARWTTDSMVLLTDIFPHMLTGLDAAAAPSRTGSDGKGSKTPPFWYPTVTLNVDFKRRLPPEGEEWLYSRIILKDVRNGRTDIEVIMMNERGEIVALANQIGLVVSASRNTNGRTLPSAKI